MLAFTEEDMEALEVNDRGPPINTADNRVTPIQTATAPALTLSVDTPANIQIPLATAPAIPTCPVAPVATVTALPASASPIPSSTTSITVLPVVVPTSSITLDVITSTVTRPAATTLPVFTAPLTNIMNDVPPAGATNLSPHINSKVSSGPTLEASSNHLPKQRPLPRPAFKAALEARATAEAEAHIAAEAETRAAADLEARTAAESEARATTEPEARDVAEAAACVAAAAAEVMGTGNKSTAQILTPATDASVQPAAPIHETQPWGDIVPNPHGPQHSRRMEAESSDTNPVRDDGMQGRLKRIIKQTAKAAAEALRADQKKTKLNTEAGGSRGRARKSGRGKN